MLHFVLFFVLFFFSDAQGIPSDSILPNVEVAVPQETTDRMIADRLIRIFGEIDDLSEIKVTVRNGVATLTGVAPSANARNEAKVITQKTEGVIYVQDQIDEDLEVTARLAPAKEKAIDLGRSTLRKLPLIVIAICCIVIAWFAGSWFAGRRAWFQRLGLNELSAVLLGRVVKLLIMGLGIFVALEILDATAVAAGVLGVAGVAGVALGFAFRNIVENYLAGILLSMRNPFSTGDAIEVGEHRGKVVRLTSRDTVLMTYDGNHLRIPNSLIMTSSLINLTRNPFRRFDFPVGVSTDLDLVEVRTLGVATLSGIPSVLGDPAPYILVESLGDSAVNLRFYGWVDQRENDFLKSKSEAIRLIKDAFDKAAIEMPEPIYRVHLHHAGDLKPPSKKGVPERNSFAGDLSVDETIDRQVAAIHTEDGESNLLADD